MKTLERKNNVFFWLFDKSSNFILQQNGHYLKFSLSSIYFPFTWADSLNERFPFKDLRIA